MSTHIINFVFEDRETLTNFNSCPDVNPSGIRRFAPSPLATTMIHFTGLAKSFPIKNKPKPYVIATGVNHHPNDWATYNGKTSAFKFLNSKQLSDVQDGKAMVLFDQSLEGYQTPWLWESFHKDCLEYNISPEAIIYTTGNSLCKEQYTAWADENNITKRMSVFPYTHFEADMYQESGWGNVPTTFEEQLEYKNSHSIKTFNCLQKRLRAHRVWWYIKMFEANILDEGLVSMNPFNVNNVWLDNQRINEERATKANSILPLLVHGKGNTEFDDHFYIRRIQKQVYLDSWVSVISEAGFPDSAGQLFLSEKIFKPIVSYHPFIIMGDRGSLKELRKMGYKTFDGFIDESYDDLPTFERFDAIIESIKKIIAIKDKRAWYESMSDILIHNYNNLKSNANKVNPAFVELEKTYKKYFKLGKYKNV